MSNAAASRPLEYGAPISLEKAKAVMVALLADELGLPLAPRRIDLANGRRVEIDAATEDLSVLVEALAHQRPPEAAQRNKVVTDAFKLAFVARVLGTEPRLILRSCRRIDF